jgi:hypothetical protein
MTHPIETRCRVVIERRTFLPPLGIEKSTHPSPIGQGSPHTIFWPESRRNREAGAADSDRIRETRVSTPTPHPSPADLRHF